MRFLVKLVRAFGRFCGKVRDALILVLLSLVYLFGVGLMAIGQRVLSVVRGGKSSSALQSIEPPDLSPGGLNRMG